VEAAVLGIRSLLLSMKHDYLIHMMWADRQSRGTRRV